MSNRLEYELERDGWLVQAFGTVNGREFSFHAKHSNWTFEVADGFGGLPSDTGNNPVFTVDARYAYAGEMSEDEARRIIERCAGLFGEIGKP